MLTVFDKLWWAAFVVATIVCMIAGASIPIIYLLRPEDLPGAGHNFTFAQAMLCLVGMLIGYAASLTLFGVLSRRFVSAATHQRWAQFLRIETVLSRYQGVARTIRWALIPEEHLESRSRDIRSNDRSGRED